MIGRRKWVDIIRDILLEEGLIEHDMPHDYERDGYGFVLDNSLREQEVCIYHLYSRIEEVIALLGKRDIHAILVPETPGQWAYVRIPKVYDDRTEVDIQMLEQIDRLRGILAS